MDPSTIEEETHKPDPPTPAMSKPNVLVICPPDHYALRTLEPLRPLAELFISNDEKALEERAPTAEIVLSSGLTGKSVSLRDIWRHSKNVKWVHSLSAGVENLLFPELVESPVPVTNARGVFKRPLAEFAVLGMLYFYKRVRRLVESQRAHKWDSFLVEGLQGKVMGVVGYGEIGRECALLAKALGVKIYATRRKVEKSAEDPIVDRVFPPDQLNQMLAEIDVLVAAAPLTPQTHHMLGERQFAAMKPSSIVINVGRGPVIDEQALVAALQSGKLAGAALDVFDKEPLAGDSPLWDMENVLISPHCTDRTSNPDWLDLAMQCFVDNFHRYQKGEELANLVDKKAGY
jgi:phosphoglycerate dehydrogenase-like enzyme